ncbi:hypothetical protein CEP52_004217 [Fusarium oligoseptatum]|uniref:non-specific serine/threonine protein kinase n=1 Tax=Fusarium oligoseptatum TaxID=2604345 RepID=A0A428U4S4_9HYPO|nr:hypothetical protein CEP52_004217 [Fusarium oligoseptatum]
MISDLLSCKCHQCKQARERTSTLDEGERREIIKESKHGQLLFALMVYLRKFHFVYVWFSSGHREEELGSALSELHQEHAFDGFMEDETERRLFGAAYYHAWKMLNPVKLVFSTTPREYHKADRFPFLAKEKIDGGNFGILEKFEILPEYDGGVEKLMSDYSKSAVGHGSTRRLLFAKKSVKISDEDLHALALAEQDMLRMVSRLDKPATDNIVTLLTCYNWGDEMHFVFPYIETDLKRLLDGDLDNTNIVASLFHIQELPENKLWLEIVGVAQALKAMHTEMKNPFEDDPGEGKVLACHFDLKPANILVTGDGKLKIGDFGHSHIQVVKTGDTAEVDYRGGDPVYAAPESLLRTEQTQEFPQPGGDGNAPAIKYDVWSLACIMIEVLIRLLSPQRSQLPLEEFRKKLAEFQRGGRYKHQFFNEDGVKSCVIEAISGLKYDEPAESAINQYISTIKVLLLDMFRHDNRSSPSSQDVLFRLREARADYRERVAPEDLGLRLKRESFMPDQTFREIGWTNQDGELVSFVDM